MKTINNITIFIIILCLIVVSFGCMESSDKSKNESNIANSFNPDLTIPDFTISTINDSTEFRSSNLKKDGIILLKYFSPDCSNCQEEAALYFSKKDSLKNIKTIWTSGDWATLSTVKEFAEIYKLEELNSIAIGKEIDRFLISYYKLSGMPFAAVYKDNQLIKTYTGGLDFSELIAINDGKFIPRSLNSDKKNEKSTSMKD